ncbi:MAG: ABC transporter substrate-binding protein [Gammaproteobacteria bacterium]|nr:ABC transporter substrate-binding protein [Gammaproteobacteria bacterium]
MNVTRSVRHKLIAVFTLLLSSSMLPITVYADDMPAPQAIVKDASDRMMQALKDNKTQLEENPDMIYGLVQDILMPNFDFGKMSKLALGKNWRNASESQRERFTEEFRGLLIRTYSTAMLEYTDEEILFLPFHDDISTKKVKVEMEILQSGGPSIPMALSMYLNNDNEWKVYDVKIDGISLVTNYRSSFSTEIRNDGMDKLIENLATRNEKIKA